MGKSQFIKNASIAFMVLDVLLFASSDDSNETKQVQTTTVQFTKSDFEENSTLDAQYQSVASQIEAFIKKQKARYSSKTKDINKTVVLKIEDNLTKVKKNISKKRVTIDKKPEVVKKIKKPSHNLPKLAIIMDDIGFLEEAKKIKKIPFAITPSIFPPNEHYSNTITIAKSFKYHMVHFPMEAYKYKNIREKAINVSDKIEVIEEKVQKMQRDFPNAVAINNHTGSKYTCDFDAMEEFFTVLNRYDIDFIDSRTSSGSQCKEAGKLLNREVLERDIFLDNQADIDYIKNQLRKAVKIAKKNGQAIAICHPRKITFKALMSSSKILEDVELVYINEFL